MCSAFFYTYGFLFCFCFSGAAVTEHQKRPNLGFDGKVYERHDVRSNKVGLFLSQDCVLISCIKLLVTQQIQFCHDWLCGRLLR